MGVSTNRYSRFALAVWLLGAGCGDDSSSVPDAALADTPPGEIHLLTRPSRSSTIALSEDGSLVAMVNPEDGSLSVFRAQDSTRIAKVPTGGSPSSVVIAGDSKTAYVANRADGTVVRVANIDGGTPTIAATIPVGAEPAGLALSPTGRRLFVAELAESRVSVIDTEGGMVVASVPFDRPRALLVTNNRDASDDDETLIIPEFFGRPVAEAKDDGRTGYARLVPLTDLMGGRGLTLAPIDSGFPRGGVVTNPGVTTAPNQLGAVAFAAGRLYFASVSASPEAPVRFDNNVFPVVYVADLAAGTEVRDASGTVNLARKIYDAIPTPSATNPRYVPGDLSDLDFVADSTVAYAVGRAGDVMVRVTFGADVQIGSTQNKLIDLAGNDTIGKCQGPTGVAIDKDRGRAYVNCWVTRRLGVVDLAAQSLTQTVESAAQPVAAADLAVHRGRRFYFTGRGRWSAAVGNGAKGGEGWSSCGSCHPDGLTDNMTWVFAAGPRQTTSQDGSFSHGAGGQKQRVFNWTGIFDEHHDFERNTRDVSGGLGAITTATNAADCGQLDKETRVDIAPGGTAIGGLARPFKELQDDPAIAVCAHKDWDEIDAFVKTIAPVKAKRGVDALAVARGRQLFVDGGCAKCHGGSGWTTSRRFFAPSSPTNSALATSPFTIPAFFPATWMYNADPANPGTKRNHVSAQPAIAADATGPGEGAPIGIAEVSCTLRNVGSFGVPGNAVASDALEVRPTPGGPARAEGRAGYNVPSLYGLALGAPYLHHGQARTLTALLTDAAWQFHTNAGNANFSLMLTDPGKVADLVTFLASIDAATVEITVPTDPGTGGSFDACPATFP